MPPYAPVAGGARAGSGYDKDYYAREEGALGDEDICARGARGRIIDEEILGAIEATARTLTRRPAEDATRHAFSYILPAAYSANMIDTRGGDNIYYEFYNAPYHHLPGRLVFRRPAAVDSFAATSGAARRCAAGGFRRDTRGALTYFARAHGKVLRPRPLAYRLRHATPR